MVSKFKCYFAHSIPKVTGTTNDDSYLLSKGKLTSLAVSDGATMAFNSSVWSRILVRNFVKNPEINIDELVRKSEELFDRYHQIFYFKNKTVPWNVIDVYEKGSFASLLGIKFLDDFRLKITAIGDSIIVLVSADKIKAFPYESVSEFPFNPILLSSNLTCNDFLSEENFLNNSTKTIKIKDPDNTLILCMTDAIGIWFLTDPDYAMEKIQDLLNLKDHPEQNEFFENLVMEERLSKRMKLDDTTLIIVGSKS